MTIGSWNLVMPKLVGPEGVWVSKRAVSALLRGVPAVKPFQRRLG